MEMEYDVKREARNQYLKYFRIWFIVLGVLLLVFAVKLVGNLLHKEEVIVRTNNQAPQERVYDEANVLSDSEEEKLRKLIADAEAKIHCDLVIRTINQPVEGSAAQEQYGYRYDDWELNMRDIADDYYDYNGFGYDNIDYSGALLLDNWYEGQAGTWLSTTGAVYEEFGDNEINQVLDEVYYTIEYGGSAYEAYKAGIEEIVKLMQTDEAVTTMSMGSFVLAALIVPIVVAAIFIITHLKSKEGVVTTTTNTYVNGKAQINRQNDLFIRKTVSTRRIQTSSSGGSRSGGSSGRGGSHRSSSGRSHGGGGRRR